MFFFLDHLYRPPEVLHEEHQLPRKFDLQGHYLDHAATWKLNSWLGFSFFFRDPYGSWHLIHNPLISTLADIVYSGPWLVGKESNSKMLTNFTFDFCITRFFEQLCMKKRWANGFRVSWAFLGMKYTQLKLSVPCCLDGHKCQPFEAFLYSPILFLKGFLSGPPFDVDESKFVQFFLTWRFFALRVAGLS